jgi:gamma-glutamylaminecyclotransferase
MDAPHLLFVYGSLLRGEGAHGLLPTGAFRGTVRTEPGHALVDLGAYPGLVCEGSGQVVGECYAVSAADLERLDAYEDVPNEYVRTLVRLEDGREATAYRLAVPSANRRIASGNWRER